MPWAVALALACAAPAIAQQPDSTLLAQAQPRGALRDLLDEQQRLIDQNLLADKPLPDPIAEANRQQEEATELPTDLRIPTPLPRPRYDPDRTTSYDGRNRDEEPDDAAIAAGREEEARRARQAATERPSLLDRSGDRQASARPALRSRPAESADPQKEKDEDEDASQAGKERLTTTETEIDADSVSTGDIRQGLATSLDAKDFARVQPAQSAGAETPYRSEAEEDPYEAIGIRLGGLILRPSIETGVTVTDNVDLGTDKESAVLSETTLRLNAVTDDPVDNATIEGFVTYRKSIAGTDYSEPEGGLDAAANLDLGRELRLNATISYAGAYEGAEAPYSPGVTFTESPFKHSLGATIGLEKYEGPLRYAIAGEVEREIYTNAEATTGTVSQEDRNASLFNLKLRGGYAMSQVLVPFAELEIGRRIYDNRTNSGGYEPSANEYALRGGVEFDVSEKLTGEIAVGYVVQRPDDDRLATVEGVSIEGQVAWSPVRGTDVTLALSTDVEGSSTTGASGSLLRGARLTIARQVRDNLELSADVSAERRDYVATGDHDTILSAELGASYWLNRSAAIVGRIGHERQTSTLPDRDYQANTAFLGVRLQR